MNLTEYREQLRTLNGFGGITLSALSSVDALMRSLALNWTEPMFESFYAQLHREGTARAAIGPAYFADCYHIVGVRCADNTAHPSRYYAYRLGTMPGENKQPAGSWFKLNEQIEAALEQADWKWDKTPDVDKQPEIQERALASEHMVLHDDTVWVVMLYGDLMSVPATCMPMSANCSLGVRGAVTDSIARAELLEDPRRPRFCYCGKCGVTFFDGKCSYCGDRSSLAFDALTPSALPPLAWNAMEQLGYRFAIEQREAYLYEYRQWIRQTEASLPKDDPRYATRNQRQVQLGET